MNMRAAVIHIMGDMVQSIGVISAAVIIKVRPEWQIADPICTYVFSVLVMLTTVPIFLECTHIIMEGTTSEIDVAELYNEIVQLDTVQEVHDFHCWSLAGGKHIMTCHIRSRFHDQAMQDVNRICREPRYSISMVTVQVEPERPAEAAMSCEFNRL